MSELNIGTIDYGDHAEPATLNLDEYDQQGLRVGIFASSGSGKGWLLGKLLEGFIGLGFPVVAIDPESELWTFQEIGALVLGGPHGDVPLPRTDEGVRKAIEFGIAFQTPIIFDLGGVADRGASGLLRDGERISSIFWQVADEARVRVVFAATEAEVFAPQQVPSRGTQPETLAAMAKRGRKRGVITLIETQRPADIQKSVISQCNVRFIGRLDDTNDYDAVKRHLGGRTFNDMRRLGTGQFVMSPTDVEVAVGARAVTHGGGTPIGGDVVIKGRQSREGLSDIIAGLREPEVPVDLPVTKADNKSVAGLVARADLDRAEQRATRAEAALATALTDVRMSAAHAESLERELTTARPAEESLRLLRAAFGAILGEQVVTTQINMPDGTTFHGNQGLGEEDIIALIRRHAPAGGPSGVALLPVEALRTRYLEAAAQRLVAAVEALEPDAREVLLYLIGRPVFHTINAIQKAITGREGGDGRKRWEKALVVLVREGLVKVGGSGRYGRCENIDAWVEVGLAAHSPSPEEVEQVKNRALSVVMSR